MPLYYCYLIMVLILSLPSFAVELKPCGEVESISGTRCDQVEIKINLSSCGDSLGVEKAKTTCEGQNVVATVKSATSNYRGVFELVESGWGKKEFKLQGKIWKHVRSSKVSESKTKKPKENLADALPIPKVVEPIAASVIAAQPPAVVTPPVPSTKVKEDDIAAVVNLLSGLSFKGSVDAYYAVNSNKPALVSAIPSTSNMQVQNKYHIFDIYHEDLQLSYARLQLQKVSGPVTTTLDFGYGPTMQVVSGTKTETSQINLKQAIMGYRPSEKLNIEAGRFVTFVGYEVIETQDNINYSQSILGGYFLPFWHQGVKASYAITESVSAMAVVTNGWNNSFEDNRQKVYGGQFSWLASDTLTLFLSGISGQDSLPSNVDANVLLETRSLYDFVAVWKPNSNITLAFNGDSYNHSKYKASAAALFLKYKFTQNWSVGARVEAIDDSDNLILGESVQNGQKINTGTLTLENKLTPNLTMKIEARTDTSSQPVFMQEGNPKSSQTMGLLGITASF